MPDSSRPRWLTAAVVALVMAGVLAVAAWSVPLPYLALSAGPVTNVVGAVEVFDEVDSYTPDGSLMMLTVLFQEVNAYEVAAAIADPTVDIVRRERIRPRDETDEEYRERGLQQMDQSKENAIAVGLDRAGATDAISSDGVEVVSVTDGAPAESVLREGDIVRSIGGTNVSLAQDIGELLATLSPGDVVQVTYVREGVEATGDVELTASQDDPDRALVGILARSVNPRYPVDIDSENVGGPSAGLMYALGIVDLLTPNDLTNGHVVAGTGTIAADGTVGGIGGIRQKVVAAEAAGAEIVLVPESNYEAALTAPIDDIDIVSVGTIDQALAYLEALPEV